MDWTLGGEGLCDIFLYVHEVGLADAAVTACTGSANQSSWGRKIRKGANFEYFCLLEGIRREQVATAPVK